MRMGFAVVAAVALAACDASVQVDGARVGGYTLEVRAAEGDQLYVITAPDGRVAAARAAEGQSLLMDGAHAQALLGARLPEGEEMAPVVSLRMPGFDLSVRGEDGSREAARISITAGGRTVEVDARDNGPDGAERAYVRITGADGDAARDFIAKAEHLSPEVQAQMRTALGLD